MAWDESIRLYRVSMRLDVEGFVLADNQEHAEQAALANLWCIDPKKMPDLDSVKAVAEPIERVSEVKSWK
jgi:hypothetical protein